MSRSSEILILQRSVHTAVVPISLTTMDSSPACHISRSWSVGHSLCFRSLQVFWKWVILLNNNPYDSSLLHIGWPYAWIPRSESWIYLPCGPGCESQSVTSKYICIMELGQENNCSLRYSPPLIDHFPSCHPIYLIWQDVEWKENQTNLLTWIISLPERWAAWTSPDFTCQLL